MSVVIPTFNPPAIRVELSAALLGFIASVKISILPSTRRMRVAGCATYPARENSIQEAVNSLLPQVDCMCIYFNGYDSVPLWAENESKIFAECSGVTGVDQGDAGMFYFVEELSDTYYFTFGDDMIYPAGYIAHMETGIERYSRQAAVSLHGWNVKPNQASYHLDRGMGYHFETGAPSDMQVDILATNTFGFHTDACSVQYSDFKKANMADLWVNRLLHAAGVDRYVLAHDADWVLQNSAKVDNQKSIFSMMSKDARMESFQTELLNATDWS